MGQCYLHLSAAEREEIRRGFVWIDDEPPARRQHEL